MFQDVLINIVIPETIPLSVVDCVHEFIMFTEINSNVQELFLLFFEFHLSPLSQIALKV